MKTITEIRNAFWDNHPEFKHMYKKFKRQNDYDATVRTCFVMYVDHLMKNNQISKQLANRATL